MAVAFACPHCGRTVRVQDRYRGRLGKCPGCGQPVRAPGEGAEAAGSEETGPSPRPAAPPESDAEPSAEAPGAAPDADPPPPTRRRLRWVLIALAVLLGLPLTCLVPTCAYRTTQSHSAGAEVEEVLGGLEAEGLGADAEELARSADPSVQEVVADAAPDVDDRTIVRAQEAYFEALGEDRFNLLDERGHPQVPDLDPETRELLERIVARYGPLVDELARAEGFAVRPREEWVRWNAECPWRPLRMVASEGMEYRLSLALEAGDLDAAWQAVEDLAEVAARFDWPTHVGRELYRGVARSVARWTTALLAVRSPGPERRRRLTRRLEALEDPQGLQRALRGELGRWLAYSRSLVEGTPGPSPSGDDFEREDPVLGYEQSVGDEARGVAWLAEPELMRDRARLVEVFARLIRASTGTAAQLRAARDAAEAASDAAMEEGTPLTGATRIHAAIDDELALRARLRIARLALALSAERPLPEDAPRVLDDPLDPDGGPLRWRRDGSSEGLIWSVGRGAPPWGEPDDGRGPPDPDAYWRVRCYLEVP